MEQDQYLRRADGSIYGVREMPKTDTYEKAWENLDTLPFPSHAGCVNIDLGPDVYAMVDFDADVYRVGLYYQLDGDQDEGGVCAEFERFSDCEAFVTRLAKVRAPEDTVTSIQYSRDGWVTSGDPATIEILMREGKLEQHNRENRRMYRKIDSVPEVSAAGYARAGTGNPSACWNCGTDLSDVPVDDNCPKCGADTQSVIDRDPLGARSISESEGPYHETEQALKKFIAAGFELVEVWGNLDETHPLPERLRFPLSLDEWLSELQAHYGV